jgi:hypothetical protein
MVFANPLLKEKRHFFDLNRFHTIDFTLPEVALVSVHSNIGSLVFQQHRKVFCLKEALSREKK